MLANERLFAGDLTETEALAEEAQEISKAIGSRLPTYGAIALAAWRGNEAKAAPLIEAGTKYLTDQGERSGLPFIRWATAVLYNGLGRYEEALGPAACTDEYPPAQRFTSWCQAELIEAAVRCGQADRAARALARLSEATRPCGTDWALGTEACARALLSDGEAAERRYREAIERLDRTSRRPAAARARLVYGEWLRRERRRSDARDQLGRAHALFAEIGMEGFAERARIELEATGERARRRVAGPRDELTPQEAQIARMAAGGATNAEIAAQLFLSPNTVAYHLRTVFGKLGITTRRQLTTALAS
jgi:DNA-binding CsgD family transcriptional regulator